ncbi:MAG: hypothetical protein J5629_02125 [Muribaculaceae bacterium]|nr:hypothetical protein [Muribaculaceae bacterium]
MSLVNEAVAKQRLDAARAGSIEEQKAYLQKLLEIESCYEYDVVLYMMMNDEDLKWLKPLALEHFIPAVKIITEGMYHKRRIYEEDFFDEDTQETVTFFRLDIIDDETVFTPDKDLLDKNEKAVLSQLKILDIYMLRQLQGSFYTLDDEIENELYRRGDPKAIEQRGDKYRYGDEENGIFVDYAKAKTYYDRVNVEFDPEKEAREDRKDAIESFPDFATYRLEGADVPAVKDMLRLLYEKFGEHSEPFMYLPLEAVMKMLVGSSAYVGYIQTIEEDENNLNVIELEVEFYGCSSSSLKYALKQVFPSLKVEFVEHAP